MVAFFFFNRFFTHSRYLYTASGGEKTVSASKCDSPVLRLTNDRKKDENSDFSFQLYIKRENRLIFQIGCDSMEQNI